VSKALIAKRAADPLSLAWSFVLVDLQPVVWAASAFAFRFTAKYGAAGGLVSEHLERLLTLRRGKRTVEFGNVSRG
jgi:hypothetical protein